MANHDKRDSSGNWLNPTGGPSGQPPARNPASVPTGLASTPSAGVLFLALRRRWPLALGLGLVAAVLAGGVTWLVISPARYMGRTLLHVDPKPPTIAYPSTETPANFSGYQKTQIALVKSRLVLGNALNQPKVAALATVREAVREQLDPIEWLERELKVDFTVGPEILRIAINGDRPQELTVLVDGIREAYLQKIVNKERTERLAKLGQLEEIYNKYQELLRRREQELRKLARSVGTSDLPTVAIKQQLTAERLGLAQKELRQMQAEIRTLQIVMQDQQGKEKSGEELEVPEGLLEQRLTQDPVIEPFRKEVARRQLELEEAKKVAQGALLASYRNRLEAAETKLNAMRDELRPKLIKQLREEVQRRLKDNVLGCQEQLALKKKLEESLQGEVKQLEEQADSLNVGSLDVEWLRRDVAHLEGVTKRIGEQTEALKVELDAPARIKVLEEAVASATNNEKKQVLAALGAALAALALVCYAVARWEYRVRRVNTAEDVVTGLGMKLLGTLPDVSGRPARGTAKRSKAVERAWDHLIAESVDAARTMLLHCAENDPLRVVMVTSALGGEGKTSLAQNLAASLARANYRTLLVDADLRRPAIHRLFDLPLAPGFRELLRAEVNLADAIQPTSLRGLWVLPAGERKGKQVECLADLHVRALFDQLRQEFDFILLDSSPVLPVADTLLIGQQSDGVIFAMLRDVSRLPKVHAARERLTALGIRVLGAVVSGARGEAYDAEYTASADTAA